ncbi:hypothetical protein CHLRE_10g462050v5 [Chlamydomonas reinhardtii]|uniref:Protein kinase domain-containing protein n=1 Tax=Chlamydomonas reinhardtii TaxID=3055 RepID=A0A2K3DBY7_CHLRE|nr:uncharacterized protein CHLRE_10g462050v5 [Chlamydomonas reinhardtii]PNW78047.1 hypothetical protein CHLRE_10g462050v5 [Chlamydomonas reinhardtii]
MVINETAWGSQTVNVTRNLTIRATSSLLAENRYAVIDYGTSVMLFSLGSGCVMTWIGIDSYSRQAVLGSTFRPLRQSPGSTLVFTKCLIHRYVGLTPDAAIANSKALPRPPGYPGSQVMVPYENFTYLTTDYGPPRFLPRVGALYDYVAFDPPDNSLAAQGLFFGGNVAVVNGPSFYVTDHTLSETCLATHSGNDCIALTLASIEAEMLKQQAQQQQQAASSRNSSADDTTTTIVVAVVVPMGSVLLAALVGSIWWVRRNRRRELEQQQPQQRAKAGGGNAANAEAGGAQEKAAGAAAGGGVRLGVLRGGVRNGDDGVFLGVDGEKDLPQWSEAAHFEGDDPVDLEPPAAPANELAVKCEQRHADSVTIGGAVEAAGCSTASISLRLSPTDCLQQQAKEAAGPPGGGQQLLPGGPPRAAAAAVGGGGVGQQQRHEQQPSDTQQGGKQQQGAPASGRAAGDDGCSNSAHDGGRSSQRAVSRVSAAAHMRPAALLAAATLEGGADAPAGASAGPTDGGQAAGDQAADKPQTENSPSEGSDDVNNVDIKVPDRIPSPEEVAAELRTLVKALRDNVSHVAIVLEGVLGHGSFGTVYTGTWQGLPVAVKTVVFSASQQSRRHALKEAALCQSIIHPNVIATYGSELQPIEVLPPGSIKAAPPADTPVGVVDTPPQRPAREHAPSVNIKDWRLYIIQELADGGPLGNLYGHPALWLSPGVVNLAAVVPLALGIARALAHLHSKRIVHGDLNPNNVLLKRDPAEPSGYVAKVGDFGLSVMLPHNRTHLSNIRMGTMFYICPAVACKGRLGPAADVFSLGVILWELYHGRRAGVRTQEGPRYCANFPAFPPTCPKAYKFITLHCLQRQFQNRPDATAVVGALEQLLADINAAQSAWLASAATGVAGGEMPAPPTTAEGN